MWYAMFLIILAVLALVASILTAGGFAVILLVIAILAVIVAVPAYLFGRNAKLLQTDAGVSETVTRVGGADESEGGRVPATPEELVDARRAAQ